MNVEMKSTYDAKYVEDNYFRYREWLYRPYISSLIAFSGLERGSTVLDVGCGQGFFSYLFHRNGMRVHGIDISESGIRLAQRLYGVPGITFEVADIATAAFPAQFNCIFVRSCSLYNTPEFAASDGATAMLVRHLKNQGTFIFSYNSNFSSRSSPSWRYHSLEDVRKHFRSYPSLGIFFCSRMDTLLLRKYAFNPLVTRINMLFSKVFGAGGELVCVLKNPVGSGPA